MNFPARGYPQNDDDLAMPRTKSRSLTIAVAYRGMKLTQLALGRRRLLRFCLNAAWLLRRFAFELSGQIFGDPFHCASLGLAEDTLRRTIPPRGSVIDIGCGSGRWCRIAARYAQKVVGIDYSAANIALARRLSSEPNVEYVVGNITGELSAQRFDVALAVHVVEHVDDVDALLRRLHALADTLIGEVPDFEADSLNLVRRDLDCPYYSDADHVREYSRDILRAQLERNGWTIARLESIRGNLLAVARHVDEARATD